jgi:hypothetical protein
VTVRCEYDHEDIQGMCYICIGQTGQIPKYDRYIPVKVIPRPLYLINCRYQSSVLSAFGEIANAPCKQNC